MAIKNTLTDLNDHLFEQLERLNDDDLNNEELEKEINRARAISQVARQIIDNGQLILNAIKHQDEYASNEKMPRILIGNDKK